jgi:hypothetical protein
VPVGDLSQSPDQSAHYGPEASEAVIVSPSAPTFKSQECVMTTKEGKQPRKKSHRPQVKKKATKDLFNAATTFSARHNTMFQGLAADGARLALWKLWRAGYRLVNFIHDEILVELHQQTNLALHAAVVRQLMIDAMQQVVPDVHIDVQYSISDLWAKSAEVVVDEEGRLTVWKPVKIQRSEQMSCKEAAVPMAMSA